MLKGGTEFSVSGNGGKKKSLRDFFAGMGPAAFSSATTEGILSQKTGRLSILNRPADVFVRPAAEVSKKAAEIIPPPFQKGDTLKRTVSGP